MAKAPILSGELGLISLFDLGQLLMLNRATGELGIQLERGRASLYFEQGQLVDARDTGKEGGEEAAYRVFSLRKGRFEFQPGPGTGSRAIENSTESIMLEAARRVDEAAGGPREDGEADRLVRRTGELDALREAFQSIAGAATTGTDSAGAGVDAAFGHLNEPGDALLCRPGSRARILHAGRWRDASPAALDAAAFDILLTRLTDGAATTDTVHGALLHSHENGRRYVVTRVSGASPALWVRAADLPADADGRLDGSLPHLDELLAGDTGLVLLGAADAVTADELLQACIARRLRAGTGTMLLAGEPGRWRQPEGAMALMQAAGDDVSRLIRAVAPDVAAFDIAHAPLSRAALDVAPVVMAAVLGPNLEALFAHWCARSDRRWGDGLENQLEGVRVGAVYAHRSGSPAARLSFTATRLTFGAAASDAPAEGADETASALPQAGLGGGPPATVVPIPSSSDSKTSADPMAALAAELGRMLRKAA